MEEYVREPCPWRIVDDCGGAFSMGTLGGGIFQAVKGFRNAPLGLAHRLRGSANAVRIRAPQIGGEAVIQPSCSGAGPKVVACYLVICRELCHLGRTLLHYRLWFSSPEEEGGPVELHNKWCSDWGHSGCTQWTGFHGGLCHDGGDSAGSDRGFRNPPHQIYGAAVSEPATLFRRARSFISRRWGSSAGGKGAVSVEEAGPESRCFYGDARRDGWF